MNKHIKRWLFGIISFLLISTVAFFIYTAIYYHAGADSQNTISNPPPNVFITSLKDKGLTIEGMVFKPSESGSVGFIFYPGGKVEYTAYAPLMAACAERGITCILVKMPFNLAVFGMNLADQCRDLYPDITTWYVGGHSLGGAIASYHIEKRANKYNGLILLAAYSTKDLSSYNLDILSIYGSEDNVMNRKNHDSSLSNLGVYSEYIIQGGNHGNFGDYGFQRGDGHPSNNPIEQANETADYISNFINN